MTPRLSESAEQRILAQWLDFRRVVWCHVPNGGHRDIRVAAELKRQGVKPGVPDVLVFSRPPKMPDVRGVALELKATKGRVSAPQHGWLEALAQAGWVVCVARGATDAIDFLHREMGF